MEKTYQLLQQVAGRSGREGGRGKVLIQTYSPQHSIYNSLKNQSRDQFIKLELQRREENNLPPFYKIAQIQLIHPNVSALREVCQEILNFLSLPLFYRCCWYLGRVGGMVRVRPHLVQ